MTKAVSDRDIFLLKQFYGENTATVHYFLRRQFSSTEYE